MKRYVGLDVSQATTAICVVDDEGRTLAEGSTATEPGAIAAFVARRAPDAVRIGMETGPLSVWLWNELRGLGLPVVCMDARHANAGLKVMLAKTDRNDAAGLAQLVRTGWFRQVHVKAESSHAVRAELATRTLAKLHAEKAWAGVAAISELVRHLVPYSATVRSQIGEALLRLSRKREAEAELTAAQQVLRIEEGQEGAESSDEPGAVSVKSTVERLLKEARGR